MTPAPNDRRGADQDRTRIDRRTALAAFGLAGAALGAGCVAGIRRGRRTGAGTRAPSTVVEPSFARIERSGEYRLSYRWGEPGRRWDLDLTVAKAQYSAATRSARSIPRCYDDATTSPVVRRIADTLSEAVDSAGIESPIERLRVLTDFVRSLEYATDLAATGEREYPKYVPQTLVENGGDCEDLATLLTGVLSAAPFDHRTALVFFSGHVGVGVRPESLGERVGPLLSIGRRAYFYVDATMDVPLGAVPDEYAESGVIAVYDGEWGQIDLGALTEHASTAVGTGRTLDLLDYV